MDELKNEEHITFKKWLEKNLTKNEIYRMEKSGKISRPTNLYYLSEVCEIFDKFSSEIFNKCEEIAIEKGYKNLFSMLADWQYISSFSHLKRDLLFFAAQNYLASENSNNK